MAFRDWAGCSAIFLPLLIFGQALAAADGPPEARPGPEPFAQVAEGLRPAVMTIGASGHLYGTGFVISREHRLIATAAHVVDRSADRPDEPLSAYAEKGGPQYRVEAAWYHPDIRRKFDAGLYARSPDPADGERVDGPDLAIVRLAPGGPDLPAECKLLPRQKALDVLGKEIGVLSFGLSEGESPIVAIGNRSATLATGRITELLYPGLVNGPVDFFRPEQRIIDTAVSGPGSSGAPIFLDDGRIVGVRTGGIIDPDRPGDPSRLGDGIRIDALYELIAYHKLESLIPNAPELGIALNGAGSGIEADFARLPSLREARRSLLEVLLHDERYDAKSTVEMCNKVITTVPDFGMAYVIRGENYLSYCMAEWESLRPEDRCKYAMWAEKDMALGRALLGGARSSSTFDHDLAKVYMGIAFHERSYFEQAVAGTTRDLAIPGLSGRDRACLLGCRAQARYHLGDRDGSRRDVDEAHKIAPDEIIWELGEGPF